MDISEDRARKFIHDWLLYNDDVSAKIFVSYLVDFHLSRGSLYEIVNDPGLSRHILGRGEPTVQTINVVKNNALDL